MPSLQWSTLFASGGPALLFLCVCFLATVILIIERTAYFRARAREVAAVQNRLLSGQTEGISRESLQTFDSPAAYVLFEVYPEAKDSALFDEVKSRAVAEKLPEIERYLGILATLGTVSPYIGLLGTVFGIIRAFMSLGGGQGEAAMSGLNAGIAESLAATAAGLFVAIPATMAFNHFRKKADDLITGIEICASRLKIILLSRKG